MASLSHEAATLLPEAPARELGGRVGRPRGWRAAAGTLLALGAAACALSRRGGGELTRVVGVGSRSIQAAEEQMGKEPNRHLALNEKEWDAVEAKLPRGVDKWDEVKSPSLAAERRGLDGGVEPLTVVSSEGGEEDQPESVAVSSCSRVGEDCSETKCCSDEGHQCYERNLYWASCMPKCPGHANWTCKELGQRALLKVPGACSAPGENCANSRCCSKPGMQCYAMDRLFQWSTCAYSCKPGVAWSQNWTCEELGERAEDPVGCAWSGEACIHNRKCCQEGEMCVRKNDIEAYCQDKDKFEVPFYWDGEILP